MGINEFTNLVNDGKIDINNQQNFFAIVIKGLLVNLNEDISLRDIPIPHFILHTGDDILYVENKALDYTADPTVVSNENYVYNTIPRCIVKPAGINFELDQLTSSHALGNLQVEYDDSIYSLVGEFRRIPIKIGIELMYYIDSYTDMLNVIQQIATKLAFIRTYNIIYLGQCLTCSYNIPDSFSGDYMTELDGTTEDNRNKTISLSLEIECNLPVWNNKTIMNSGNYITRFGSSDSIQGDHGLLIYPKEGIKNKQPHETVKWNFETGKSN